MSLVNTANAGIFSADRSVAEYAKDIWNIKKVKQNINTKGGLIGKFGSTKFRTDEKGHELKAHDSFF